jgi:hypothetical protein
MAEKSWELVEVVNDALLAEIFKGLLEAQGVMVNIVREGYQAAYGITGQVGVRIEILAPSDQVEFARQVIADYHAGKFEE